MYSVTSLSTLMSGGTLAQGMFAMKVRSETARRPGRLASLLRGTLAHPLATVGLLAFASVAFLRHAPPWGPLLGLLLGVGLCAWHAADFATSFFDKRRRLLHDIFSRTRLQYVTYRD